MKKLLILLNLLWLNACQAEPNFAPQSENKLPEITRLAATFGDTPNLQRKTAVAHSGCLITVQQKAHFYPARLCQNQTLAVAEHIAVLPDTLPILFQNKVLFLGEPDNQSYQHGVLGDDIEAKTLYTLDAETLKPAAQAFRLPENLVFENNTLAVWGDKIVAVISGNGAGARVAVLALQGENWQIIAESAPLPSHRWQSPFVFADELYSVQMPHLRGRLVKYQIQNNQLIEQEISENLSNHAIGTHDTQIAAILPDYALIPQMGFRNIVALDRSGSLHKLSPELPAKVVRSVVVGERSFWLLADGSVWTWAQPIVKKSLFRQPEKIS